MKHILKQLPWLIRAIIGFSLFMTFVYCVTIWTLDTLCTLFLLGWAEEQLSKHWKEAVAILIVSVLSIIPAFIVFFTLKAYQVNELVQIIAFWGVAIYALSVIIDQDRQKPYIWLWKQAKRLFKQKNHYVHTV